MSEIKVREIFNGWLATDKEGNEWAFGDSDPGALVDWFCEELHLREAPVEQPSQSLPPESEGPTVEEEAKEDYDAFATRVWASDPDDFAASNLPNGSTEQPD